MSQAVAQFNPEQQSTFNPRDHVIKLERKSKKKDSQGRETWTTTITEYLPVAWRIFWFREENHQGKIDSHAVVLDLDKGAAVFETYVEREDGGSARMHGSETQGDWKDYIEKAQTKSLGRALAAVGYGSQFTDDEFAEGERIVDSPVARAGQNSEGAQSGTSVPANGNVQDTSAPVDSAPSPQPAVLTDQAGNPINASQLETIRKICAAMHKAEPERVQTLTYLQARGVIQQLTSEYNTLKQKKASKRSQAS